ncbi:hypothetical protein B0J11DRAFT_599519 [Dendryphion nanum]|uniref:Glucose-methanol-choline oxidoreductase N-terminal domain-containing protein n=1 Tax=Dendryphion nanum TaxID=256645 RepID=A0A9P9D0H4_9PLEO|nr:hypothetical protein B0J11DRAFT_599519 [Dendryphion nanum]
MTIVLPFVAAALVLGRVVAQTTPSREYDYVIVGSGPGGGSLAANLAATGHSVFLIEAGGDSSQNIRERLPPLSAAAAENPPHSWQFFVEHFQNQTQARRDSKYTYFQSNGSYYTGLNPPPGSRPAGLLYPRGATLGGSSQVNAMNYAWAPDSEWDYIANLTGDPSWGHRHMRRHFMGVENCTYVPRGTPGHGFDGYLESSQLASRINLHSDVGNQYIAALFHATENITINSTADMTRLFRRDINRIDNNRYARNTMFEVPRAVSLTTGGRSSLATYINRVITARFPLTLSTHSLATRIILDQSRGRPKAVGVEYLVGEGLYSADARYNVSRTAERRTVRARKEVIVSAGTFNTPQILKLSGIGPREELEALGIPVAVDLPAVGNYMQDNYEAPVTFRSNVPWMNITGWPCTMTFNASDPCFVQFVNGTGNETLSPYSSFVGSFTLTYRSNASWNQDADLFFLSSAGSSNPGFFPGYSNRRIDPHYWSTAIVKMQTGNPSGTVRLRSLDPRQAPIINFNYFAQQEERDLQALAEGVRLLVNSNDRLGVNSTVVRPDMNNLKQSIKDDAFSHHAVSTCRMGPRGHRDYCVDSKFRVNGVNSLRVVDASVFPRMPGAMPNTPTFTISRKAFEAIVSDNW